MDGQKQKKRTAAMDMVFGVLLVLFSIYVIITSTQLKFMKSFTDGAGFFPCIIGCVLLVLGAVLAFIGVKAGGVAELKEVLTGSFLKAFVTNDSTIRVVILLAMMFVYMFFLIDWLGFRISSAVYLFANFMYLKACKKVGPIPGWVIALIVSVVAPLVFYYAFKLGLGITLP